MAFNNGHALVIGVGDYIERRLQTPKTGANGEAITVSDARGVAAALVNPQVCAYPDTQVTFLPDEQTTKAGMTSALQKLATQTGADDTVVIFFCGHGSLGDDDEYYFGTRDVKLAGDRFKRGTGLSKKEFLDLLREVKAQKLLLIINACFSGNVGAVLGVGGPEEETLGTQPPSDMKIQVLGTGEGRAIITASRSSQFSCFDRNAANTFFGKALMDALQGKGMPTGEFISLYDLYNAVYKNVKTAAATVARLQEPVLTIVDQVGPFPIALAGGAGTLGVLGLSTSLQEPPAHAAVEKISKAEVVRMSQTIRKGGITISGGNISVGGDMVAGDKVVHGDEVHGDKVMGDKVEGDKFSIGSITGSTGLAFGRGASATVHQGGNAQARADAFAAIYAKIQALDDTSVDRDVVQATVKGIERETAKGDQANPTLLERGLKTLAVMATDIFDVTVATLTNPLLGISTVVKKIAEKAKQEAGD